MSRLTALTAAAALVLAAGCSASTSDAAAPTVDGFPLTLENCGRSVTVDAPPQRAVSLNQSSTEILLSLGLADRMVGTATWTDPVRENLAEDNARVPRLADDQPSLEVVSDADPDFVSASFGGTLGPGGVADRDRFEQFGIPSYLSPTDCVGMAATSVNADGARAEPLRLETVYQEIRDLAAIFDVRERGEQLVAELTERAQRATDGVPPGEPTVAYWFSDVAAPYMAGCCGASGVISSAVGARNVFADTTDEWPQIGWEAVADRNPDVLVLADLSRRTIDGDALDSKIAFLEANPVTSRMRAVIDRRYVVVNGADLNPSIRTVDGIETVAAALKEWGTR
ncbi:ABC transporter substrate-binding protein [Rhodococcoides corynebacterioides]|uniref:ABC transporter substrate-binding protein n=1 Tax=Rhodococcoides corynebacterioides TaxID=53972 RepID=UPI001C9A8959|nr:ABC transporter substrate-binding protein [Rhodococcus corynebacterioides]MBY6349136.1 ABC transporter substrate-binding protein [Rhodococcus corynebacterioides]